MIVVPAEAIALGMTWLVVYFIVFILVAYKLGFGVRGVIAGISLFYFFVIFNADIRIL